MDCMGTTLKFLERIGTLLVLVGFSIEELHVFLRALVSRG